MLKAHGALEENQQWPKLANTWLNDTPLAGSKCSSSRGSSIGWAGVNLRSLAKFCCGATRGGGEGR